MWKLQGQKLVYAIIQPIIDLLIRLGVTPNMVTVFGLLVNVAAAGIFIYGAEFGDRSDHTYLAWAGATILFAGLFDMMDGRLAREGNMSSSFGALFDSVLDRYSELVMFLGICYYLVAHDYFMSSLIAFVAMIGSIMVSYTRARAEGLGANCSVGIMQRPERILIISLSLIACGVFSCFYGLDYKAGLEALPFPPFESIFIFTFPLTVLAVWTNATALNRLRHGQSELETKEIQERELSSELSATH